MAITSGFFNAKVTIDENNQPVYDRAGTAEQFAAYFAQLVGNGVFMKNSTNFQVLAQTGMNLTIKAGYAWINGYWACAETDQVIALDSSPTVNPRIDRVVLRLDLTQAARSITLEVKKGTESATPTAPALTRNSEVYEIALADVNVAANTAEITQASINDLRLDTNLCGAVTGLIDQVDTSTLYAQIQADLSEFQTVSEGDFNTWIASIKDVLDDETAGHLLLLIQNLQTEVREHPFVELEVVDGQVTIDTSQGSRFHVDQSVNTTYSIQAQDGDAFYLLIDVLTTGITTTFPTSATIIGELENTAGARHELTFMTYGEDYLGHVLGKE